MGKKKYYAIIRGRKPGIYDNWDEAKKQVLGFSNPKYRGFPSEAEARQWQISGGERPNSSGQVGKSRSKANASRTGPSEIERPEGNDVVVYTDGACKNNPGPGGYGILILHKGGESEMSAGFKLTTNNRMELLACIVALESLEPGSAVTIYSDSAYVVNSINKGWVTRWKSNDWKRNRSDYADNIDLWERYLAAASPHRVTLCWVKGHANNPGNERCDRLAVMASGGDNLQKDHAYEAKSAR